MNVRKIFFPVAAGLFISPALWAADIDGPSDSRTFSNELLSTADVDDTVQGDTLALELGAEYTDDDVITLSFTGTALDPATMPTSVVTDPGGLGGGDGAGLTLGLLSATADEAVYRVTEVVSCDDVTFPGCSNTTVGVEVEIAGPDVVEFNAQAVDAASTITVSFEAETSTGLPLDTGGGDDRSTDYIETDAQFSAAMTPGFLFDETIDVNQDRKGFVSFNCCDDAFVDLEDAGGFFDKAAFVDQDVVWEGDFSWIIDTDENTPEIEPLPNVVFAGCAPVTITTTEISYTCPFTGITTLTFDVSNNDDPELQTLPDGPFSVSVTANFTGFSGTEGSTTFAGIDAGEWDLNGFKALIPYMPYGTNISQVIYLVNRGSQFGDVTVDYTDQNGMQGSLGVVASLGATTTLSLGAKIRNALPSALKQGGRLGLTVTANVPAKDVQINSQYNVSGNRAFTLHEDNRP